MGNGEGEFPSLADTIAAVRRELSSAQATGRGEPVQFRTGPVELEFDVGVTRTRGGQAGVQIWVLTLGGKLEREHATTQRIKVTLQPVDPETGEDAQVSDARRGGGLAGPPPLVIQLVTLRHRRSREHAHSPALHGREGGISSSGPHSNG